MKSRRRKKAPVRRDRGWELRVTR